MEDASRTYPADRCPAITVDEILDLDSRTVPDEVRGDSWRDLGTEPVTAERYTSTAFFEAEKKHMWPNVWQMAAREDELLQPGDYVVYNNVGRSYLIMRQDDGSVKAFHNVCLHRGRKLRTESGSADDLTCPFHGFAWKTDGAIKHIPCEWDFQHLKERDMSLPELRVERWQGFIYVTESTTQVSLRDYMGAEVYDRFSRWRLDECYTALWVGKVINANWKAVSEAFMEAWHSIVTHPQILPYTGDANTRYSMWGDHANLALTPFGLPSPHLAADNLSEDDIIAAFSRTSGRSASLEGRKLAEGETARTAMAETNRANYLDALGYDSADISDSEMLDAFTYNIFPNLSPWGGFVPNIVYRWRPWPDQNATLMEVRLLARKPKDGDMPEAAEMRFLGPDQPWATVTEWGALGEVFDQDMENLPYVQEGLIASANNRVELGRYQEGRIRQFHQTMDKYLAGQLP
ncbi:aromatic ring-hydroxylating oxygenase subunit alpha [Blastomonas fulva]|uniref:aromatic ring-hydroxylating oxygenase subunit alpha n=1 Tax=Blastomonas fulva TaxID=1550728 RepID=UPI0025A3D2E6|nr:aromatic ring-hydroxylating dioxygenase subunit alpha [Blastomonas fulva]MDM7927911.1 aromatic ring-hydroxylating dioxygenase subunit alpha [Blastomonas fulva]MDM7965779.1 aromatic ring-hydroxylating dioxygenase subunit alpha [Blastomonas fulva]